MNPIQRAMLFVGKPFMQLWNDKVASRSGRVGRFGKFFSFGFRENGSHATTRFMRLLNYIFVSISATLQDTQSVSRSFTQNNAYITRFYGQASLLSISIGLGMMIAPYFDNPFYEQK